MERKNILLINLFLVQSPLLPLDEGSLSPSGTLTRAPRTGSRATIIAEFAQLDESINAHMEHMNSQEQQLTCDMVF